jgi:hypothetical protein
LSNWPFKFKVILELIG